MTKADPLIGARIDRYQVERQIGAGGMGRVYVARQPEIGARVAIKVVNAVEADREEWTKRLFAEAKAVNLISHENIVNVLDMVRLPDGRPALVMEYLNGVSLDRLIHESGAPLPLGVVGDVGVDVLSAIGAAHRAGILHRDLKPANVFVSPEGRAKVLDFGIAKSMHGNFKHSLQTQVGRVLGTAVYMAPEQARGERIDERSDLFAVGLILYEAITRRRAVRGPALGQVLEQHRERMPSPSAHRAEVTPELDAVIARALELDPADRYPSAGEMAGELRAACASLLRDRRTELTAALQATGRIEIGSLREKLSDPEVVRTAVESAQRASKATTAPERPAPVEPPPRPRWVYLAFPVGVALALVAMLFLLRSRAGPVAALESDAGAIGDAGARAEVSRDAGSATGALVSSYGRGHERAAALIAAARLIDEPAVSGLEIAGAFTAEGFRLERVTFTLFSPARIAAGARPCAVIAEAANGSLTAEPIERDCSSDAHLPAPSCSVRDIMAQGWLAAGVRARGRDVSLVFRGDTWELSIDGLGDQSIDDACGETRRAPTSRPPRPPPADPPPGSADVLDPFD